MREASLECIDELARTDERVVFVGSDVGPGTLERFRLDHPERFFMEGICEQLVVGMAAGLALEGFIPFVNSIATFLTRRCFEQVAVDLCLHDLPVRLIAYGGGVVYTSLGPTHQAIEDFGVLRSLPNMTVVAPCDAVELRALFPQMLTWPHPIYVRLSRGGDPVVSTRSTEPPRIGRATLLNPPGEVLIVSTGVLTQDALAAARILEGLGIAAGVAHVHTLKPLDAEALLRWSAEVKLVVTLEEHVRATGLGSAVLMALHESGAMRSPPRTICLGLPDAFIDRYGTREELLTVLGLDAAAVASVVAANLSGR